MSTTVYPSVAASEAFSPSSEPKLSVFSLSASTRTFKFSPSAGLDAVLTCPTTEIATGYRVEDGYEKNMRTFSDLVTKDLKDKAADFHGAAVGTSVSDFSKEEGGEKGNAVTLFVGWDSREAHLARKETGGKFHLFYHYLRRDSWLTVVTCSYSGQYWPDCEAEGGHGYVACQL